MLTQSRKLRFSYLRRLMILPIAILIFSSLAFVVTEENIEKLVKAPLDIPLAQLPQKKDSIKPPPPPAPSKVQSKPQQKNGKEIFTFVEQPPAFPGGEGELNKYLSRTIRYPHAAVEKNIQGTVFVSYIVADDGTVTDVKTVGAPKGGGLEDEAMRVVKSMPKWVPGRQNGNQVNVQFNLPIRFVLQDGGQPKKKIADDGAYLMVEEMPTYPGGQNAMMQYLSSNVRYPKTAVEKNLTGTVYVRFDIDTDGSISNVQSVNKAIGGGLEEEAIRVVKKMPNWNPGKEQGKAVRVRFVLPVNFRLSAK